MRGQRFVWWAVAALILTAAATAPALAQEGSTQPALTKPGERQGQAVEEILRQQEAMIRGQDFTYDPSGRRDPFLSLYDEAKYKSAGPRPKGIAGMLVTEIDLVGIVRDPSGGDVAFFKGSDNKGYFLKVGDKVYDGVLVTVDARAGTVTFRQHVDDPRLIKPYRDVVKRLVPVEEVQ